jgi:hypothetical protein
MIYFKGKIVYSFHYKTILLTRLDRIDMGLQEGMGVAVVDGGHDSQLDAGHRPCYSEIPQRPKILGSSD